MIYLAMNTVFLHGVVLVLELFRPTWTVVKTYRDVNPTEYWLILLGIAFFYRVVKGNIKKSMGIEP